MPTLGDIQKQLNPHYIKWQEQHNGARSQYIIDLVNSESFKVWAESHPNGQVDDYLEFLKEGNSYYTSPEYRIEYLRKELETIRYENSELSRQLQSSEIQLHNQRINFYIACGISSISILLSVYIIVKFFRLKRSSKRLIKGHSQA